MILRLVLLSTVLVGLIVWDRSLAASAATERQENVSVGQLVSKEDRERITGRVAAIEVEQDGRTWMYVPIAGQWRCAQYAFAPALESSVTSLLQGLLEAEGIVQTEDPSVFEQYGIGVPGATFVTFHGSNAVSQASPRWMAA